MNLRIALASIADTWSVAVIGKNLTDEKTMVWRNDAALTNSNSYFGVAHDGTIFHSHPDTSTAEIWLVVAD